MLVLGSVLVLGGPPAHAELADPEATTDGMARVGPFFLSAGFALKNLGYDDNLFLAQDEATGDYTMTLGGSLKSVMKGHRGHSLLLEGALDRVAYVERGDLDHTNGSLRARGSLVFRRFLLSGETRRLSRRERPNSEIDARLRQTVDRGALSLRLERSGRTSLQVRLQRSDITFAAEDAGEFSGVPERLNRNEQAAVITVRAQALPKTGLLLEAGRHGARFDDPAGRRDTSTLRAFAGLEFDPTAAVTGAIRLGRIRLQALDRAGQDYEGPAAEADLSWTLRGRARIKARYERDAVFSSFQDQLFYLWNDSGLTYTLFVSPRVAVELESTRARSRYHGLTTLPDPLTGGSLTDHRLDRVRSSSLGLRYRTVRGVLTGIKVVRWERDSNFDRFDVDRVTVMGIAEYAF